MLAPLETRRATSHRLTAPGCRASPDSPLRPAGTRGGCRRGRRCGSGAGPGMRVVPPHRRPRRLDHRGQPVDVGRPPDPGAPCGRARSRPRCRRAARRRRPGTTLPRGRAAAPACRPRSCRGRRRRRRAWRPRSPPDPTPGRGADASPCLQSILTSRYFQAVSATLRAVVERRQAHHCGAGGCSVCCGVSRDLGGLEPLELEHLALLDDLAQPAVRSASAVGSVAFSTMSACSRSSRSVRRVSCFSTRAIDLARLAHLRRIRCVHNGLRSVLEPRRCQHSHPEQVCRPAGSLATARPRGGGGTPRPRPAGRAACRHRAGRAGGRTPARAGSGRARRR